MCIPRSILRFFTKIVEIDVPEVCTQINQNLLFAAELFTLCFLHLFHLVTLCWYTGDNVRLSDVVKFLLVENCNKFGHSGSMLNYLCFRLSLEASRFIPSRGSKRPPSERDMYMNLWKNYVVMACCIVPHSSKVDLRSLSPNLKYVLALVLANPQKRLARSC